MTAGLEELEGRVAGVGVLVVCPETPERGFASLMELRSRRSTHKVAGSRTIPLESLEPGETPAQTLDRLTKEEIQLRDFNYDPDEILKQLLCTCELRAGVLVPIYLLKVPSQVEIIPGSESQEVSGLSWMSFEEVLDAPKGDLGLRPGTREAVRSYFDYNRQNGGFEPRTYRCFELEDSIPDEVFDLVEAGFSVRESLFRLRLASEPSARSLLLVHSQSPQVGFSSSALAR